MKTGIVMVLALTAASAQAQMVDLMGSMAVDGALTTQSVQQVSRGRRQVLYHQFVNAMDLKNTEILTSGRTDYSHLPISRVSAGGVTATFQGEGAFYQATFSTMTPALCRLLIAHTWPNAVEVRFATPTGSVVAPFGATSADQCDSAQNITLIFQ